ncbi:MAG TPA: hypothetical protein VFV67_28495 [Actinophytocola sp.]|uniref:hypothetical protein n=1 Tax=Actinophytocola sp. TaxID=1872138 RepID=UPI002DB6D0CC|nr:hypothetical protein [Actinophytocola sp.]HEU5474605.1 hypothetical protein [Actinophytocola sp.]
MASFDAKRVTPLEWAGIGAGALAFIVSFFPWYSVDFGSDLGDLGLDLATNFNAWDAGFLAWFPVLLLVAAAVVIALPHFGTEIPNRSLIWLGLAGAAVLFIVLRWLTFDSAEAFGTSAGPAWGLFLGLVVALVSGVAAFLSYRGASSRTTTA